MRAGRSDASTSTEEDIKARPLCLFYFTHPFGVLSPEPPVLAAPPPPQRVARAYLDMQPASPYSLWAAAAAAARSGRSADTASYATTGPTTAGTGSTDPPRCPLAATFAADTLSSSLLSSDLWLSPGSSRRSPARPRHAIPYSRILPPLRLPMPRDLWDSTPSVEIGWAEKFVNPAKFSLPPIELPAAGSRGESPPPPARGAGAGAEREVSGERVARSGERRAARGGVSKRGWRARGRAHYRRRGRGQGRDRPSELRRLLARLLQRPVTGEAQRRPSPAPALREALQLLRDAWPEPLSLRARTSRAAPRPGPRAPPRDMPRPHPAPPAPAPPPLRRRYSVPEIIMRKYRLAQQRSESEKSMATTCPSPASASDLCGSCGSCGSPGGSPPRVRRDPMRKAALLRRARGRAPPPCCSAGPGDARLCPCLRCGRETRSLDGSRSELGHWSTGLASPRLSPADVGWGSSERRRLDLLADIGGSEMLRTAMRNNFERTEELRYEKVTNTDQTSDLSFNCHGWEVSSNVEPSTNGFTNGHPAGSPRGARRDVFDRYSELAQDTVTLSLKSDRPNGVSPRFENLELGELVDDQSFTDTSDALSLSVPTVKETNGRYENFHKRASKSGHIDGRISERSPSVDNENFNLLPFERGLSCETSPSEVLEIVVSETINANPTPEMAAISSEKSLVKKSPPKCFAGTRILDLDEYVSNILVESLNSLTDQIESMNASMTSDRKISILEKEIKVKLHNTGVNTIVHLSPTSNNPIIFGNEELYNYDEHKDECNNEKDKNKTIREEIRSVESNNNFTSADTQRDESVHFDSKESQNETFDNFVQQENVNKAVLQQIQKLFEEELQSLNPDHAPNSIPSVSHIEISNVDVFIDNNADEGNIDNIEMTIQKSSEDTNMISGIGAGNYYRDTEDNVVVPRFSAFPHTESMEVNTSSSEDPEVMGSECTSLVDSLDDPNSPRSMVLRRCYNHHKRSELVRSAIDVLELLPESSYHDTSKCFRDKGESFFIRIKDNDCDCEKENIVVADHMPEKIKQRLYRRHRKRELRMECARRSKVKQMKRELDKQRHRDSYKAKRELEKECMAIIDALIEDIIGKITQDEYKYMRIRKRNNKIDENLTKMNIKRDSSFLNNRDSIKLIKNSNIKQSFKDADKMHRKMDSHRVKGKLSLHSLASSSPRDHGPKRIYQKSELHDGDKCVEILEILEYIDSETQSSPETTNSDENHNNHHKNKKSRIPVPVAERFGKLSRSDSVPILPRELGRAERVLDNIMANGDTRDIINFADFGPKRVKEAGGRDPPARRASVPHSETRSRSNSLRFKNVFDIIPEERSSLSVDSSNEDPNYGRRVSAPDLSDEFYVNDHHRHCRPVPAPSGGEEDSPDSKSTREPSRASKSTRSATTSPSLDSSSNTTHTNKTTMTSPCSKSAATSPIRGPADGAGEGARSGVSSRPRACLAPAPSRSERRLLREEGSKENSKEKSVETEKVSRSERKGSIGARGSQRTLRAGRGARGDEAGGGGGPPRGQARERKEGEGEGGGERTDEERGRTRGQRERTARVPADGHHAAYVMTKKDKQKIRMISVEKNEQETINESVKLPDFKHAEAGGSEGDSGSDSGSGSGGLLGPLAPRWLAAPPPPRPRRAARRRHPTAPPPHRHVTAPPSGAASAASAADAAPDAGGWSVTVAGSCRAALPADVEMRLRFPSGAHAPHPALPARCPQAPAACPHCAGCGRSAHRAERAGSLPAPASPAHYRDDSRRLTLTMKKEALDSSIVASKSVRKSSDTLPELETYRATESKTKSSLKTQRGRSRRCWLPGAALPPSVRSEQALSVLGSAIVPELKPRVPTMSERDLTRVYTPRLYLRL